MQATISVTSNGKALEELSKQIQRRAQVLNQTTEKACIAVAITVMKSLRAGTVKSKGKVKQITTEINGELQIAVVECGDMVVGFKTEGGVRKPCVRRGGKHGPIVNDTIVWWRTNLDKSMYTAKVFKVTLSDDRARAWPKSPKTEYIVAQDIGYAQKITMNRYSKIVKRYTGLGKDAWSRAMMLASDKPAKFVAGDKTKSILNTKVFVSKNLNAANMTGTSGEYSITVSDDLRYAGTALKGGEAYVTTAMMKAANSVNGMLNNYIKSHSGNGSWFSEENLPLPSAPFPPDAF